MQLERLDWMSDAHWQALLHMGVAYEELNDNQKAIVRFAHKHAVHAQMQEQVFSEPSEVVLINAREGRCHLS